MTRCYRNTIRNESIFVVYFDRQVRLHEFELLNLNITDVRIEEEWSSGIEWHALSIRGLS